MLKKIIPFFSLLFVFSLVPEISKASHVAGGEITYTCLGGNQYQVNLNLFIDCAGFNPGAQQTINFTSSCGGSTTLNVDVSAATTNGLEISQLCPAQISMSTCNGGTLPGMWLFNYTGVVTLSPACDTWTMSWSVCCRNSAITNVSSGSSNYYIEATLNSATAACNSSPEFTAQPIPYVCAGQPVNYSYGVVETDGDSLYYSLVSAMDGAGIPSTYNSGYSGTSPIPGITIDPNTGLVSFTPTALGNFVVVILVQEYDDNGNLVGTVMRDIQFVVQSCTNAVPSPTGGTITGFTGNAVQTGPYSLEMCAGNSFAFTATYTDPDAADILTEISNISAALPGAVITSSGTNPLTLNISWNAPAGTMGQSLTFTITISDGACPIPGQQTFVYSVNILDATTVDPDLTICGSQTAQLNAYGGSVFNWSVVSGPPMTPANFSCNPCANPIASPAATTTYAVISNLSGTCDNMDTVTVYVVPDFTYTITQSSFNSCLMDPVQLAVSNVLPAGVYTYQWTPAANLNNPNIANPTATFTAPGTYTFTVVVTSPQGCTKTSTLSIVAAPAFAPSVTASNDTSFCGLGTVNLGVTFNGAAVPPVCGLSTSGGCGGTALAATIGTGSGSNSSTTWPAIYGNWYTSEKHQMLFTAAELNAAGVIGGKIDQIDVPVTMINGITTYHNFTIKMGCTNLAALGTTWESGLLQVFGPSTVNIAVGMNANVLSTAFEWDGISNIIVEICSTEGPGTSGYYNYTQSSISPFATTGFTSCLYSFTDANDMCPDVVNFITTSNDRPVLQFHYCSMVPDPSNFSFLWTPASGAIANATAQNTTGMPPSTMDYYITVTNNAGGCTDVDTVHVDIINISTLTITPAGPYCVNGSIDTLQVSVPTGTGLYSGAGITNTTLGIFNPAIAGVGTHEIYYNVNGSCGTGVDSIAITVIPPPDPTITPVANQCTSGSPITLSAASAGGVWSGAGITDANAGTFDPTTAGIGSHIITYMITTPCTAQDTVLINVTSQLDATITHVGPFCTSAPAITLETVDPGGIWSGPGITDPILGTFDPSMATPGNNTITYTISGLCGNTDSDVIVAIPAPVISFTSDTTSGCEPTTVNFTSTTNQPGGSYFWDLGNGQTSTDSTAMATYTIFGQYNVTLMYANTIGCSDTIISPDYITIYSQPAAAFTASPQPTSIVDPEIHFTDYSTGQVDQWIWSFGNSTSSNQQNPTYMYADTGTYHVQLVVTNVHGCVDTANSSVVIDQIVVFYAPNAFTPNGNGNNDVFRVLGDGIDKGTFEMSIYNRWGELIFKTNDYNVGWNGAKGNSGALVEQDAYVWRVIFRDFAGKKHEYLGHVTMVQ
ncbi:MAG: hypothetical protein JWP12_2048 [Bacteroidetes bacterium]|nr:hypothetical protein [Bacteroidota bacterium]